MSSVLESSVFRRRQTILHQVHNSLSFIRRNSIGNATQITRSIRLLKESDNGNPTSLHGEQSILDPSAGQREGHPWNIRTIPPEEDPEFWASSPSKRGATRLSYIAGAAPLFLLLWAFYLQVQCLLILNEDGWSLSREFMVPRILLCMEVFKIVLDLTDCVCRVRAAFSPIWRSRYRLEGDHVPRVDVIITCCNESIDIIQDTVLGALTVDYPQDSFRVILTDDGASAAAKDWVASLKKPNLYYTARVKRGAGGYKAGNLNHAVAFIETLPGGPADFIAGLDADMIPEKKWLRSVFPHLLLDPKMGVATPKQDFYNIPAGDALFQSNQVAWAVTDFARDSLSCAWNSGSGYILRRAALDDIGGFSLGSITEDVLSSMMMLSKGWKTAYLAEELQFGLIPSSYLGHVKQQTRWNIGGIQLGQHFGFYLSKSHTGQLNLTQRLSGFWCLICSYRHILCTLDLFVIPTFSIGQDPTQEKIRMLALFVRVSCIASLTHFLHDYARGWVVGYRSAIRESGLQSYMAPYYIIAMLRSFILPRSLGGTEPGFKASGSISDDNNERCVSQRSPVIRRAKHMILGCGVWYHVLLLVAYMPYTVWRVRCIILQAMSVSATLQDTTWAMLPVWLEMAWLIPRFFVVLAASSTPLRYMCFPPDDPPRDNLMGKRDEKTGARYSTNAARQVNLNAWHILDFEFLHSAVAVLNICILIGTRGI